MDSTLGEQFALLKHFTNTIAKGAAIVKASDEEVGKLSGHPEGPPIEFYMDACESFIEAKSGTASEAETVAADIFQKRLDILKGIEEHKGVFDGAEQARTPEELSKYAAETKAAIAKILGADESRVSLHDLLEVLTVKQALLPVPVIDFMRNQLSFSKELELLSTDISTLQLEDLPAYFEKALPDLRAAVENRLSFTTNEANAFLQGLGFTFDTLPVNYIEEAPKDMKAVMRNRGILEANMGAESTMQAAKDFSARYYESLRPHMEIGCSACAIAMGLVPKEDGSAYLPGELLSIYQQKRSSLPPPLAEDENFEDFLKDLAVLESGDLTDKTAGEEVRQQDLDATTSAAGLFLNEIHRARSEIDTSVEVFNPSQYLTSRNIGGQKPPLADLQPAAATRFDDAGIKLDRDSWKSKFPNQVGFSKDHGIAFEATVNGSPVKVILTMDGEGHMGQSESAREKTEAQMREVVETGKTVLQGQVWNSQMEALDAFRNHFEAQMAALEINTESGKKMLTLKDGTKREVPDDFVSHYDGKPMIAMVDGDKAYFVRDKQAKADGGFIILGKEGRVTLIGPEDVPYKADLNSGDRLIAATDGIFDGLVESGLKQLTDKALMGLPKEAYDAYTAKIKEQMGDAEQTSLIVGVQLLLENLIALKFTPTGTELDALNQNINQKLEKDPYLGDLRPALEAFLISNEVNFTDRTSVTRLRLGSFLELFKMDQADLEGSIEELSLKSELTPPEQQDLIRKKLVLSLMISPHFHHLQPSCSDEEIDQQAKELLPQLVSDYIAEAFTSQGGVFRQQDTTPVKKHSAYAQLSFESKSKSNKFMDAFVNKMFRENEWVDDFGKSLAGSEIDVATLRNRINDSKEHQVEAALCRKMLPVALGGVGESLEEAMEQLNGFAVSSLISSARPIKALDDSTVVGTVIE